MNASIGSRRVFLCACLFLAATFSCLAAPQYIDVIYLKNGQRFSGVITEQLSAGTLKLETLSGSVLFFDPQEIERIVKESHPDLEAEVRYQDVVFLNDGVIFRGMILELIPGTSIRLETEKGLSLAFGMDEIWKIEKQKVLEGVAPEAAEEEKKIEELKLQFELQIVRRKPGGPEPGSPPAEAEGLKEEVDRLEEEKEYSRAEMADLKKELQGLVDELMEVTKGMWTESLAKGSTQAQRETEEVKKGMQDLVSDIMNLTAEHEPEQARRDRQAAKESLASLNAKVRRLARDRRSQDIEATKSIVTTMLEGEAWKDAGGRAELAQLASSLPVEDRKALYEAARCRDAPLAAGLNLIPLLGFGSWVQGDIAGVFTTTLTALGGSVLYLIPYLMQDPYMLENKLIFEYLPIGTIGAGYIFSLVRPFLVQAAANRRMREALLPSQAARQEKELAVSSSLSRGYLLLNVIGFLGMGPYVEAGLRFLPETTLGLHIGYPALGFIYQYLMYEPGFDPLLLETVSAGINLSHFFPFRRSSNRLYIGCNVDAAWEWHNDEPEPVRKLMVAPGFGYRLRYPGGFFLNLGLYAGIGYWFYAGWSDPSPQTNPWITGEISVGFEILPSLF